MFTEVSAKTGMNVDDVFTNLGQYTIYTVLYSSIYTQTILIYKYIHTHFNQLMQMVHEPVPKS